MSICFRTFGKVPLKDTDMERDLGVLIDHELKFHLHAAGVVKKCKSLLAVKGEALPV